MKSQPRSDALDAADVPERESSAARLLFCRWTPLFPPDFDDSATVRKLDGHHNLVVLFRDNRAAY